ncbi:MAG TPA: S41 family peptidase [Candidatus Limnocylindria bacterium]|nr:S41 family peptidase [Candidatus Limnocylindria bacterium]
MLKRTSSPVLIGLLLVLGACTNATPSPTATPAVSAVPTPGASATAAPTATGAVPSLPPVTGDQPQVVTGQVTYSNVFFTSGVSEPLIILEDQGGFVTRDRNFEITEQSQVIGQITSDFFASPFSYSLTLPAQPRGSVHDVDHDGQTDAGVQVYAVAYWTNIWGDPYLELRDQSGGGWSSAYASTKVSDAADAYLEVYGGKYLVYALDGTEEFPSGFGPDNKLFTDDDPLMAIPAGWSVIDMDQTRFAVSREAAPVIDLYEPESIALDDFSDQSYTQAFDSMNDKFRKEYAWTELKGIDWDAMAAEHRPAFAEAEANHDPHAYALALRDYLWAIPDTHVGFDQSLLNDDFITDTAGGVGFSMTETDDHHFIVDYVTAGGPAAAAGINFGAEIFSIDGVATADAVSASLPWSSPFSNPETKRLQQLRYALRFQLSKGSVDISFQNRGGAQETASVDVVQERDSFNHSSSFFGQPDFALPVEFAVLPTDPPIGYIQINSFFDNQVLTIQLWERAIEYLNNNGIGSLILDLRHNGGGSGWMADQMAAYFFDHRVPVGNTARYDPVSEAFFADPTDIEEMIPPRPELQYSGTVAVLVGPSCASACEFFSYNMTREERAFIVGQYSTEGAGGSVDQFVMPEGVAVQITIGRAVNEDGNVHIEGTGVAPTVKVPVTFDTIEERANGGDPVLSQAETLLGGTP